MAGVLNLIISGEGIQVELSATEGLRDRSISWVAEIEKPVGGVIQQKSRLLHGFMEQAASVN